MKSFQNKVVVVTGAGSGIGRAAAIAFARLGADVVTADVDESSLSSIGEDITEIGRASLPVVVDVSVADQVESLAQRAIEWRGGVDLVMNNAGVSVSGPVEEHSLEDWRWLMGVNLWGVIHGVHYFLPHMLERGSGYFVNVASGAGLGAVPGLTAYSTSKFAVVGLSEALRAEVLGRGVGVTVVCPGYIKTGIQDSARGRKVDCGNVAARRSPEKLMQHVVKAVRRGDRMCLYAPETRVTYYFKRLAPGLFGRFQSFVGSRLDRFMES